MSRSPSTRSGSYVARSSPNDSTSRSVTGRRPCSASAISDGPFALAQVVTARFAGHGGITEDTQQVVPQLEGDGPVPRRSRRSPSTTPVGGVGHDQRRGAAGVRWCTSPTCSGATCRAASTLGRCGGPARAGPGIARPSVRCASGHRSACPLQGFLIESALDISIASAHDRHRSPTRIAAASPKSTRSPAQPACCAGRRTGDASPDGRAGSHWRPSRRRGSAHRPAGTPWLLPP